MGNLSPIASFIFATQFSLSQFGLHSVDEIGYINISVLHHDAGDQIIVSDVRKSPPSKELSDFPLSKDPAPSDTEFLVSRFDRGNRNTLNGYFNAYSLAPASTRLNLDGQSLVFEYTRPRHTYAGLWIHLFDSNEPRSRRVYFDSRAYEAVTFSVRAEKTGERFAIKVMDHIFEAKEDSIAIGSLEEFLPGGAITSSWQTATVPLSRIPKRINRQTLAGIVFETTTPSESGKIFLKDLVFRKASKPVALPRVNESLRLGNKETGSPARAMWLWETEKLQTNSQAIRDLVLFCKNWGINEIFVQIPYEASLLNGLWKIHWNANKTRPFIRALNKAHLKVHALDGDASFALEKNHGRQLALIEAISAFNHSKGGNERFAGVRFDDEPYLLREFNGVQKEIVLAQFVSLLKKAKALTKNAGLELGADIPFWFDARNTYEEWAAPYQGESVWPAILNTVDNIGIMDYRTIAYGADGVIAHAEDKLKAAEKLGKRVFVGLETVPLPNETNYEFDASEKSTSKLILTQLDEDTINVRMTNDAHAMGGEKILSVMRTTNVRGSKSTFHDLPAQGLKQVIAQTENEFATYKSFAGVVLHSYESLVPFLKRPKEAPSAAVGLKNGSALKSRIK